MPSNNVLITNVDVLTPKGVTNSSIAIADGRFVGVSDQPADFRADETIDGTNMFAMPGFFNAHCHAAMVLLRGSAEDLPIEQWFNNGIWRSESALTEDDVYWGTALAACEMIRSGTVAFSDHYFWMNKVAEVAETSGLKALLAWCMFGSVEEPEMGNIAVEQINAFTREYRNAADGRIKTMCGPHSPYVTSKHSLESLAATAQELGVGCHIHVAETADQMRRSKNEQRMTPIQYLDSVGIFENPSIAAHAVYLDHDDIEILRDKNVSVVACPKTHMKLTMGTTRIVDLLGAGVNVALGTDGAASNNAMDMFEAAKFAALLSKHETRDASVLSATEALKLATRNGAVAMGFHDSGAIEVGKAADFILIDTNKPHLIPRHNAVSNMVYAARPSDVSYVFVNGKQLLKKGELLTLDQEKIMHEAAARGLRLVQTGHTPVQTY